MAVGTPRPPQVLVLRALGLGDLLTGVPALRAVRRGLPGHRLVLAAPAPLAELAALTGAVNELLPTPGLGPLAWPGPPPELAINLHGRGPRSHAVLAATGAERLVGFAHADFPAAPGPRWRPDEHEVARWCRLVESAGWPADRLDLHLPAPATPSAAPGAVVVHPGAASGARRWPVERFAVVARALHDRGERVVVSGSPAEAGLAHEVAQRAGLPAGDVLAGRTHLVDLAALVARARLVICGDTGLGHLATAYGVASVLLFGPVAPALWGPPAERPQHVVLWHGSPERPGDPHAGEPDPALLRSHPAEVLAAALPLLDRPPR